ncbi:leukocyte-associated immunoglobulin-like receptor 1 isoform X2 [Tamandua tetradactyla]|uniref:leukocyte-associated immunoglobulin-like receptor 1 isoform X2 n=1 Tax=Tamandua tetradactyla TaxID=48850 RepID=UPI0040549922
MGSAMLPAFPALLGLGHLPKPSILAEPGPVTHQGGTVTFVCRGSRGMEILLLEKEEGSSHKLVGEKKPQHQETGVRFPMAPASEDTAGRYYCIYYKWSGWSQRSDFLELTVTDEDTTQGTPTSQALPSDLPWLSGPLSEHLYVVIGVYVACLLCLLFLVLAFRHSHRRTHRPPRNKREAHRPQERISPGVEAQKGPPGVATEEKLPEDREKDTSVLTTGPQHLLPEDT